MGVFYIMLFGVGLVGVAAFGKSKKPNQSFTNPQFLTEAVHRSVILKR